MLFRRFLCLLRGRLSWNPGWFLCVSLGDRGGGGKGDEFLGRGKAGSRAKRGCKGKGTLTPVNTRVVAGQPRETEHHLEMSEGGKAKGKVFGMDCMNTKVG